MKNRNSLLFVGLLILLIGCNPNNQTDTNETTVNTNEIQEQEIEYTLDEDIAYFYENNISGEQVLIKAVVIKNLADDNDGSRHQKFLIKLGSEQTLLVAHNIDVANRVKNIQEGDEVEIYGQYEWNDRGGVIHWTHHDLDGDHIGGWIDHDGIYYE